MSWAVHGGGVFELPMVSATVNLSVGMDTYGCQIYHRSLWFILLVFTVP